MLQYPSFDERVKGQRQGHGRACDRRRPCAAVGLDHVAVENDCALAERMHVNRRAQTATDEALNLVCPAADLAALAFARRPCDGGAGQHGVLGRNPAAAGVAQPPGHTLFDGGAGEHPRVAQSDQNGALSRLDVARREGKGSKLVIVSTAGPKAGTGSSGRGGMRKGSAL